MTGPERRKNGRGEGSVSLGEVVADKYKVLDVLGRGGFGTVFLVEITAGMVGEKLALKILSSAVSQNDAVRDQFLNEIRVAMKMVDKYIVQIRDVGTTADGRVYYTMDYCPGKALSQILREEGRLGVRRAVVIALKVLRALRTAHSRGIIHRDLKPANIMVEGQDGRDAVRVLDFGIATALRGPGAQTTSVSGSPLYMPPEQFLGEQLGLYTDLYAVGAVLYECLTGRKPYPGRSAKEVFDGLKRGPPPAPTTLCPELADYPGLSETVLKALERNPERRYQTAREFFDQLSGVLQGETEDGAGAAAARRLTAPRALSRRRFRRPRKRLRLGPWALLASVLVIAAAVAFVLKDRLGLGLDLRLTSEPVAPAEVLEPLGPEPPLPAGEGTAATFGPAAVDAAPRSAARNLRPRVRSDVGALVVDARAAATAAEWESVLELAEEILESEPENFDALRLLGAAYTELSNYAAAAAALEKAHRLRRTDVDVLLLLARVNVGNEPPDWTAAELLLETVHRRIGFEDPSVLALLAEVLAQQGKEERLLELLVRSRRHKARFEGWDAYWSAHVIEAAKTVWSDAEREAEKARESYEAGEIEAAAAAARAAVALTDRSGELGRFAGSAERVEAAALLGAEMRLVEAEIAVEHGTIGDLDDLELLLSPLAEILEETPASVAPTMGIKWRYLSGRLDLLSYEKKGRKRYLDDATAHFDDALRHAEEKERGERDEDLLVSIYAWRARAYAHLGDYSRVVQDLKRSRGAQGLSAIYEQAWTYFLSGEKTTGDERIQSFQSAADRLKNITNLPRGRVPAPLAMKSLDLLGQCYLRLARYENKDRLFVYAANKFLEARAEGLETPELYRDLGAAYEEFSPIRAAQTYRDLYMNVQPNLCNCLLASEKYLGATGNAREARNVLGDGIGRFEAKDRRALEKALQAIEQAERRGDVESAIAEIGDLRQEACR